MKKARTVKQEQAYSNISVRSFVTIVALLLALLLFCGSLSYFVPQGSFERDIQGNILPGTYQEGHVEGIPI